MPEGHTIHRLARDHLRDLGGEPLAVTSPQGRAAETARVLDGRAFDRVDAHGKHLLYRFEDDVTLHVHLGLFGRFRRQRSPADPPRGEKRLRLVGERWTVDLSGAVACELLEPPEEEALLARIGPDPLRDDADPDAFVATLARRRRAIGSLLLDQEVVGGIGNVYRAEILHVEGIDPHLPARELGDERARHVWDTTAAMLRDGLREGRIQTVRRYDDVLHDRSERDLPRGNGARCARREAVWVYRRDACQHCGTDVERFDLGARRMYACPRCQPAGSAGPRSRD